MDKEFYIGQQNEVYSHRLDISSFPSIEQLRATLAQAFGFTDAQCVPFPPHHPSLGLHLGSLG
jgi:hypothetical protein